MPGSLITLTPRELALKAPRAVRRRVRQRTARVRDRLFGTREKSSENGVLNQVLADLSDSVPEDQWTALAGVTDNYLQGRFDLLGSGWLDWHYGVPPAGREGHRFDPGPTITPDPDGNWVAGLVSSKNLPAARNIWRLIEGPYLPIDWQLDARSGARWGAAVHTLDTPIGSRRGADVKLPWELSKLQHLPRLALAFGLAKSGKPGFRFPSEYAVAYRNQVCDFLALNPPRFGANWATAMLVGIRVVNLVVAHDLFRAAGATFDPAFERLLVQSTREHADHILHYLDWWDLDGRNNHYLANIAGLAFAGAYLPESPQSETLLAFAKRELESELNHQFNPDGSHFEGSTAYHASSAEMVAWTWLVTAFRDISADLVRPGMIPREARRRAFDRDQGESTEVARLFAGMESFLGDVTRPDGRILQIGDNDSGRLLKLDISAERTELAHIRRRYLNLRELPEAPGPYWDERQLDYRSTRALLQVAAGQRSEPEWVTAAVAQAYAPGPHTQSRRPAGRTETNAASVVDALADLRHGSNMREHVQEFECDASGVPLSADLERVVYPDFGIVLFRSSRLWLAIRCGGATRADGGHSHADALSFELHVDGKSHRVDPGAYVYTSLPWRRRQFRSEAAHGTPRLRGDGFASSDAVFAPSDGSPAELVTLDRDGLVGRRVTAQGTVYRVFRIEDAAVRVIDLSEDGQPIHVEPLPWWSPGYGRLTAFEAGSETALGSWLRTLVREAPRPARTERSPDAESRPGRRAKGASGRRVV